MGKRKKPEEEEEVVVPPGAQWIVPPGAQWIAPAEAQDAPAQAAPYAQAPAPVEEVVDPNIAAMQALMQQNMAQVNTGWSNSESWQRAESMAAIDPEIVELCDKFFIEEKFMWKLNEVMQVQRLKGSYDDDMKRLWCDLDGCRNPVALLVHLMGQMKGGKFIGHMSKPDEEVDHLTKKFKLDPEATKKLCEYICKHPPELRQKYYCELEQHLDVSSKPSACVMMLLRKIRYGDELGEPKGEVKGGKGGKGKDDRDGKGKDGGKGRDRRDDDRGRDRDDRGRDRDRDNRDQRDYDRSDRNYDREHGARRDRPRDSDHRDFDRERGRDRDDNRDRDRDRDSDRRDYDRERPRGDNRDSDRRGDGDRRDDNRYSDRDSGSNYDRNSGGGGGGGYR